MNEEATEKVHLNIYMDERWSAMRFYYCDSIQSDPSYIILLKLFIINRKGEILFAMMDQRIYILRSAYRLSAYDRSIEPFDSNMCVWLCVQCIYIFYLFIYACHSDVHIDCYT